METNQFRRAESMVTDTHRQSSASASSPVATPAWLVACLLILLGVAFELGILGFGPYNSGGIWVISVIGKNGWIMLTDLVIPQLDEMTKIWPLILVSIGSAILLVGRRILFESPATSSSVTKKRHGN